MNHARVKALKGDGKTVSKKAQKSGRASGTLTPQGSSPVASLTTSPAHSTSNSRVASDVSDNEEDVDFDLDDVASSVHSAGSAPEAPDNAGSAFDFDALMDHLQDRKHNNSEAREKYLQLFVTVIRSRYNAETQQWLDHSAIPLSDIFLKGADRGATPRERHLSLLAYCLTVGTGRDLEVYESANRALRHILPDEDDEECKVLAIYALCMTALYGGGSEEAAKDVMKYLMEIIETDGDSIESLDDAVVVSAALRGWAFVASHVENYSDDSEDAMDALVDQLDSSDVEIQTNAASCIALIFESSREHERLAGRPFPLTYDPQRLAGRLGVLAKLSSKSISKKSRRDLRDGLTSVVTSLERGVGPHYSTALYVPEDARVPSSLRTDEGMAMYGHRCKLRLGNHTACIDTWSLYSRVGIMKILFRGGLEKHVFANPVVEECLEDADWDEVHTAEEGERRFKASTKARKR